MRINTPAALFVAAEEFAVAGELSMLLRCAEYVEEHAAQMLVRRLSRQQSPNDMPAPPTLPVEVSATTVVGYHARLRLWLAEARRVLRKSPVAARSLVLAEADDEAPSTISPDMSDEELMRYMMDLDESAKLLAFYCDAMIHFTPMHNDRNQLESLAGLRFESP